jgi:hypothetical protein
VENLATKLRVLRPIETVRRLSLRHAIFCRSVYHMPSYHETLLACEAVDFVICAV